MIYISNPAHEKKLRMTNTIMPRIIFLMVMVRPKTFQFVLHQS